MMCVDRVVVDVVDHRGERRALARTGGAGDEHEAALLVRDALEHLRQAQLVDGRHRRRNDAEDEADRAALVVDVAAEAAQARDAVGQVHLRHLLEPLELRRAA